MIKTIFLIFTVLAVLLLVASCFYPDGPSPGMSEDDGFQETPEDGQKQDQAASSDSGLDESQTIKETIIKVHIDKSVPFRMWVIINKLLKQAFQPLDNFSYQIVFNKDEADIAFDICKFSSDGQKLAEPYYFATVVSFFSLIEEIGFEELRNIWSGSNNIVKDTAGDDIKVTLLALENDMAPLRKILGPESQENLRVIGSHELHEFLKDGENTIAIIPFELIRPDMKVLRLDGKSVLDRDLNSTEYSLAFGIEIDYAGSNFDAGLWEKLEEVFDTEIFTNRCEEDLVSIIMTGVTALTRKGAETMDTNGILYPAEKISDILLDADITHISNEVSFVEDCHAAKPNTMVFCSKPEYMELLKSVDTDVIELTGNHIIDYGREWFEYTIDIYEKAGIPYFGGGKNLEDAMGPATFDINGYSFAFIGANTFGPSSSWATEDSSGSAPINTLDEESKEKDMQKYEDLVKGLVEQGYNVIFTFQYQEIDSYKPAAEQIGDFERISDAGAVVVSGSQAHIPQGIEIRGNSFINYGLGNLFFVQDYQSGHSLEKPVRQGIITKHIFYEGDLINSILITTIMDEGQWQPRPTEGQERAELLKEIFNASIIEAEEE